MGDTSQTSVTIPGVPASIPRSRLIDMIVSLGIDPNRCKEIRLDRNGIKAEVYATIPGTNQRYVNPGGNEPAMHSIHIKIDD